MLMLYCIHPNLADLPLRPAGIVINQKPQNSEIAPVTAPILEKCINHRLANRSLPPPSCTQSTEPAIPFFFYLILAVVLFVHNAAAHCFHEEMERPREGGQKGRGERHLAAYIHSVVIIAVVGRGGEGGRVCSSHCATKPERKRLFHSGNGTGRGHIGLVLRRFLPRRSPPPSRLVTRLRTCVARKPFHPSSHPHLKSLPLVQGEISPSLV